MSKESGKVQAKSSHPIAMQTASKGHFTARPFPKIAKKEQDKEANLDHSEHKGAQSGAMIDNINRSFQSLNQPVPSPTVGLEGVQAKLTIGAPGDKYEQEADRVAADVVQRINSPEPPPLTPPPFGGGEDKSQGRRAVIPIQHQAAHQEKKCRGK